MDDQQNPLPVGYTHAHGDPRAFFEPNPEGKARPPAGVRRLSIDDRVLNGEPWLLTLAEASYHRAQCWDSTMLDWHELSENRRKAWAASCVTCVDVANNSKHREVRMEAHRKMVDTTIPMVAARSGAILDR